MRMIVARRESSVERNPRSDRGTPGRHPAPTRRTVNPVWAGLALKGQSPVSVSRPTDASEREADRVADSVMRMRTADPVTRMPAGIVQRKCAACEAGGAPCPTCDDEEGGHAVVHRKADTSAGPMAGSFAGSLGGGAPLDAGSRAFFEPRFDRSFGDVRVHAGGEADRAARGFHARAFTVGSHLVFAAGEYEPHSERGRGLIAHELAHVLQQQGGARRVQRSISVDPAPPTNPRDPFATTPSPFGPFAFSEADHIVHSLCDAFNVDSAGNVVSTPADLCTDSDAVAGGGKPLGCCCLCTLTAPGSGPWTIHFTGLGGPTTRTTAAPGGDVFLHPRTSNIDFGNWTVPGTRELIDPVIVAGHELCGHAALLELGVHPPEIERVDTNVHDPTVRVQNLLQAEQGLPGSPRGLATDAHRGESFARVTIREFPLNASAISTLPAAEQDKIQLAKDFINANNTWVDIFGHSDLAGSASAKLSVSQQRARTMTTALTTGTRPISPTISRTFGSGPTGTGRVTVSGPRITKVEGRSDFDAIPGAAAADLRRVDIVMPTRPAGAEVPPAGTPTTVTPVGPESLFTFIRRRLFGNECQKLLTRSAWF